MQRPLLTTILFRTGVFFAVLGSVNCCNAQTFLGQKSNATTRELSDFSSDKILADLTERGVNPLRSSASATVREAFVAYDSQTGGGHNFNGTSFAKSAKDLNAAFGNSELTSHVHAYTARPGARIKFRLYGNEEVLALPRLTNDAEDTVPIGLYVFWAERDGKASSKPEPFRVIKPDLVIDIEEGPQ